MKKAVIVHCWGGSSKHCWYSWVKKELENRGFEVVIPDFPNTDNPKMTEWLPLLQKIANDPNENLYLIGHSLGCITIMRYLESLEENQKIGGAVFVAGFNENVGFDEIQSFFETPMDLKKIRNKVKSGFVAIHSDNDPYVDLKYADILRENLGAEVIIKHNANHFSGSADGVCEQLPDVVESIEKLAK